LRHIALLAALVAAVPGPALARPVGGTTRFLATGPGDQTDPSLDAGFVVFTDRGPGGNDVVLGDLASGALTVVAGAAGDASEPDLSRNVLAYRTPEGIALQFLLNGALLRSPAEPGAAAPTVTPVLAAWEVGPAGDRDIAWYQLVSGVQDVLVAPGDQRAPAAAGGVIAWIDEASGGAVMLHDLSRHETRPGCDGRVDSVSIDGSGASLRLAVSRSVAGGDPDVEVWDGGGNRLAALVQPGVQRNPRIAGDWVAFEDLSAGRPQAVLWNHVTGLAWLPRISPAAQGLGDLAARADLLTLAFTEVVGGGEDLALYTLPLPLVDDGTGSDWPPPRPPVPPARCDDADPTVLATLLLARERPGSQAGEVSFTTGDEADLPVLLCIDGVRVDDAEVSFDGVRVASPADFRPGKGHLERKGTARGGAGLLSAILRASCASALKVRVLADPGQVPSPPPAGALPGGWQGGTSSVTGPGDGREAGGCAAGTGGPLALVGLLVHLVTRRRRPRPAGAPAPVHEGKVESSAMV
jgi:hypothetical protein